MSGDEFSHLAEFLLSSATDGSPEDFAQGVYRRAADAIRACAEGESVNAGAPDIAGLLRHVLRHRSAQTGVDAYIRVPLGDRWPGRDEWRMANCRLSAPEAESSLVTAQEWLPEWVESGPWGGPASPAEAGVRRRAAPDTRFADAFLTDYCGWSEYSSAGQQQAVRSVLSAKPGATILVNLPTGGGKSAAFICPSLLLSQPQGVTVVVVPTTALALDQERAVRGLAASGRLAGDVPSRMAFFQEQSEAERADIRARIRAGTQRILFTSPESLIASLAPSLYIAAAGGMFRHLAIDEAHLVAQWGASFRPAFQAMGGLRTDLLRLSINRGVAPFKTILLSGTLTEDSLRTLLALYAYPGPVEVVSAVALRNEASYWSKYCRSETQRTEIVREAISNLPRPLLLYTTTRAAAGAWFAELVDDGYRRVALVTGDTRDEERLRTIAGLRGEDLTSGKRAPTTVDIVVATSAFGLGIDQPDVRSVVHSCVPENIDRFYQEVGRAGRDGNACMSLLAYTDEDVRIARGLGRRAIITQPLARKRWDSMMRTARPLGESRLAIDLSAKPSHVFSDSDENKGWNTRTLLIMARAGMLELDGQPPPMRSEPGADEGVDDSVDDGLYRAYLSTAVIRLVSGDLASDVPWASRFEPARRDAQAADSAGIRLMLRVLEQREDIADVFQEAYAVHRLLELPDGRANLVPQLACGGCFWCRASGIAPYTGLAPIPPPVTAPQGTLDPVMRRLMEDGQARVLVVYFRSQDYPDRRSWISLCEQVAAACVRHGVRVLIGTSELFERDAIRRLYQRVPEKFVFFDMEFSPMTAPALPTLIIHDPRTRGTAISVEELDQDLQVSPRLILLSRDVLDPEKPASDLATLRKPSISAELLLTAL
jgi:ATP-dependent DNA helicase RecQ